MRPHSFAELTFEAPPRLSWPVERRLSQRAVAVWQACCRDGEPPIAGVFLANELALYCCGNSVGLTATAAGVDVSSVGAVVAASFGLACGRLTAAEPRLAAHVGGAFDELLEARAPVSFEAELANEHTGARLLTRAVLLPLLDDEGRLTRAHAIMTWKEMLGGDACSRLRGELDAAGAGGRSEQRRSADWPAGSLHAVFATANSAPASAARTPTASSGLARRPPARCRR